MTIGSKNIFIERRTSVSGLCSLSGITEPTHIGILHGGPLETSGSGLHEESGTMVTLMSAGTRVESAGYTRYHLSGSASAPDYIIADITSKPSGYYVQVWTKQYEYGKLSMLVVM